MNAPAPAGPRAGPSFDGMAIGLLFVGLSIPALLMPAQSDTFWQLREGAEILRTGHVPRVDSYSYTAAGARYVDHEWLSEVLLALGHRLGGMPGVELVAGAAVIGAMVLAYRLMVGPRLTRFALLALTLSASSSVWILRPQVFTLFAVALLAWLLARERFRFIPPLFLAWANLHGGVVAGALLLGAAFGAALVRWRVVGQAADRRRLGALAIVLALSLLALLATPLGVHLFPYVVETARRGQLTRITEWAPPRPTEPAGAAFWLVALGFWSALALRGRSLRQAAWADWAVVAATLALFPIGASALRNVSPFLLLAGPAASRLLGPAFHLRSRRAAAARPSDAERPRLNLALLAAAAAGGLAVVATSWRQGGPRLDWRPIDRGALAALAACPGRLYNQYGDGGYLIFFAPERPVFIDNRQDPYPLSLLLEDAAVERGQAAYRPLFARWRIDCAFLPAEAKLAAALAADGWRARYRDARWALLAAPGAQ